MQTFLKKILKNIIIFFDRGLKLTCTFKNDLHPKGAVNNVNKGK